MGSRQEQFAELVALNNNFPFAMFAAAITLTVATAIKCGEKDASDSGCDREGEKFTIVMSIMLTIANAVYLWHAYYGLLNAKGETISALTLFVAWTVVSGYATFEAPFEAVGNGFVAAWIGFIASLGNLVYNVRTADEMKQKFVSQGVPICVVLMTSIVVIIASVAEGCCDNDDVLGIVTGSVSLFLTIIRIFTGTMLQKTYAYFIAVWWMVLGLILTFGLFDNLGQGNGYIATWSAIVASVMMASQAQNDVRRASIQMMQVKGVDRHNPNADNFETEY